MRKNDIYSNGLSDYFSWLCEKVCYLQEHYQYSTLLWKLFDTDFEAIMQRDLNRTSDGLALRNVYLDLLGAYEPKFLRTKPCSVLEMMIALADRCENQIMEDDDIGNRTGEWFWGMIENLGLSDMVDGHFVEKRVDYILARFMNRTYDSDGKGGLFTVHNPPKPIPKVEIWYQMNWFLSQNYL